MEKSSISDKAYNDFLESEIARWIKIQEDIGLDVLVHGEFERNDMVEFFGEKLQGFLVTKFGWSTILWLSCRKTTCNLR